jgi:opacity protein-like surface antigen
MSRAGWEMKPQIAAVALVLALALAAPAWSEEGPRTAMDDRWHFAITPYFWFTALDGTVSMKGLAEVPVDVPFSDIWDNLDVGILGRFEARRNRVGFWADTTYIKLGVSVAGDRPILGQLGLKSDVRSVLSEGIVFYRVTTGGSRGGAWLDVLGGVRYVGTTSQLKGKLPDGTDLSSTKQTIDWVDGLVGARFHVPLGSRLGLHGRGDVAGLGSDFSWNLLGGVDVALGERWALGAGYRHLDVDYDKDEAGERQLYKVKYDGAYAFVSFAW